MALPAFDEFGDLPQGVYLLSFADIVARFGFGSGQREAVTARLRRVHELALATNALDRIIVFGSYVTNRV